MQSTAAAHLSLMMNPSARKHLLCASIRSRQLASPFVTTHKSRGSFVSGQLQQIFFPLFPKTGAFFGSTGSTGAAAGLVCSFPIACVRQLFKNPKMQRCSVPQNDRPYTCVRVRVPLANTRYRRVYAAQFAISNSNRHRTVSWNRHTSPRHRAYLIDSL